jgi:chorismate mutase
MEPPPEEHVLRAVRGATTVDEDTAEQVTERVRALMEAILERNAIEHDDIVSILFTATDDVTSMYPATAARQCGLTDVALLGARELPVEGGTPRCIRVLVHAYSSLAKDELRHVYLEGARGLRDDLPT